LLHFMRKRSFREETNDEINLEGGLWFLADSLPLDLDLDSTTF